MAVKKVKPTSPGRRFQNYPGFEEITESNPERSLLRILKKSGGRNANGRVTSRRRGGGHKRYYRVIDFKRDKEGVPAKVATIEYDPNRSARIALLHYADGEKRYIIAPLKLSVGDTVMSGPDADIQPGNTLPLANIPLGTHIHNIELRIGKGGQIVRSAGTFAQLMAKEDRYALVKLPSGEVRMVLLNCKATVGQLGNVTHENVSLGKAGRNRWKGRRPKVRGVAMNPVEPSPWVAARGVRPAEDTPVHLGGCRPRATVPVKINSTDRYIVKRRTR